MSVTVDMIAVALGQTAPEPGSVQEKQWELWIDDAAMLIEARRVKIDPTLIIDEARLDYVIRQSVVTHIKKPDDATQVTVSVDDASTSRTYQSGKGRISIADEWWDLLGLVGTQQGAFAVDMAGGGYRIHLPWCAAMVVGAGYCSCGADIAGRPIYEGGYE